MHAIGIAALVTTRILICSLIVLLSAITSRADEDEIPAEERHANLNALFKVVQENRSKSAAAKQPPGKEEPDSGTQKTTIVETSNTPAQPILPLDGDALNILMKRVTDKRQVGNPPSGDVKTAAVTTVPAPAGKTAGTPVAPGSVSSGAQDKVASFNREFGQGSFENISTFFNQCKPMSGCAWQAATQFLKGAESFVILQDEKLDPRSAAYTQMLGGVKGTLSTAMGLLIARPGKSSVQEMQTMTKPVMKRVFSDEEREAIARQAVVKADNSEAHTFLGIEHNQKGDHRSAVQSFDRALSADAKNTEALSGRAFAHYQRGDYAASSRDARAALVLDPRDEQAFTILKLSKSPGGTIPHLPGTHALPDTPDLPAAVGAGGAWEAAGQSGAAALSSGDASAPHVQRAAAAMRLGDYKEAVLATERALEQNPKNVQARALASMARSHLKDFPGAVREADEGLKLAPANPTLHNARAFAYNRLKDYSRAAASADAALKANPRDAAARANRAYALGGMGDRAGMLSELRTAAAIDPRFQGSLESALKLPQNGEILFLFPGETSPRNASRSQDGAPGRVSGYLVPLAGIIVAALAGLSVAAFRLKAARNAVPETPAASVSPKTAASILLAGQYRLGNRIGEGGMGVVYEGRDLSLDRRVAVKKMRPELRGASEKSRLLSEARIVAKLQHPNIVSIHSIVEQDGEVYLVFEYVEGENLSDHLAARGPLPAARALELFSEIAAALDYAHGKGIIHRDLKLSNIMVERSGRARIMDFGVARVTQEAISRVSTAHSVAGTPRYMAPEAEQGEVRRESDIYSMGLCFYEMLTGMPPFAGAGAGLLLNKMRKTFSPASQLVSSVPRGYDEALALALDPDPAKRPASGKAFIALLGA